MISALQEAGVFYLTPKKGKEAVRQMHQRLQGPQVGRCGPPPRSGTCARGVGAPQGARRRPARAPVWNSCCRSPM